MIIKYFKKYKSLSARQIIGLIIMLASLLILIGGITNIDLIFNESFFDFPMFISELIMPDEAEIFFALIFSVFLIYFVLFFIPLLMVFGFLMFAIKPNKSYISERNMFELSRVLKWNNITPEMKQSLKIPNRYIRYTVADVSKVTERMKNGDRLIFLKSYLYTFNTQAEKIVIFTDAKQFVFSDSKELINSEPFLETSIITQIGEN